MEQDKVEYILKILIDLVDEFDFEDLMTALLTHIELYYVQIRHLVAQMVAHLA